jgi:hypothetical protein
VRVFGLRGGGRSGRQAKHRGRLFQRNPGTKTPEVVALLCPGFILHCRRCVSLSFGGNIDASALRLRQKLQQLNCLHHGLEVLNNPVPPPSTPSARSLCPASTGVNQSGANKNKTPIMVHPRPFSRLGVWRPSPDSDIDFLARHHTEIPTALCPAHSLAPAYL